MLRCSRDEFPDLEALGEVTLVCDSAVSLPAVCLLDPDLHVFGFSWKFVKRFETHDYQPPSGRHSHDGANQLRETSIVTLLRA